MGIDNRPASMEQYLASHQGREGEEPDKTQETKERTPQEVIDDVCEQISEYTHKIGDLKESGVFLTPEIHRKHSSEYQEAISLWEEAKEKVPALVDKAASAIQQVEGLNKRRILAYKVVLEIFALGETHLWADASDVNKLIRKVMEVALQEDQKEK